MNKFIKLNNKSYLKCKNLLFIQINEFKKFLTLSFKNRKKVKLYHLLKNFFPVYNNKNTIIINYIDYFINKPIYSIKKCLLNNLTYEVDIKILLHIYSQKHNINKYKIVYLTKCPLMTKYGSFIFNGSERVVVSQLYRPNNIFFYKKPYKNYKYYSVKIIPKRGIWIDMYINEYKIFYFIIDKKKKIYITTFLRFLGYKNNKDILKLFKIIKKKKITKIKKKKIIIYDNINNKLLFINSKKKININKKFVYLINDNKYKKYFPIINTLLKEKIFDYKKIINTLYNTWGKYIKNINNKYEIFEKILFNKKIYEINKILRYKLNNLLKKKKEKNKNIISKKEFIFIIKYLTKLDYKKSVCGNIDDLSNRRIKTIYDQLLNLFKIGLSRLKRNILDKLNKMFFLKKINLSKIFNIKIVNSILNTFFGTNQLSQFMDQTNILSEITHKRRLSLLGIGGITKNKASYKIRDVHNSFYGRICPIETPEGPNIGLISSLCIYTYINKFKYLTTPYISLKDNNKIKFLPYYLEKDKILSSYINFKQKNKKYLCRYNNNIIYSKYKNIDYLDIDYNQIISLSVSQIPFLEHNDANRILMGSNMLRQTIPLLYNKTPIINNSLNKEIIYFSKNFVYAKNKGIINYVDNKTIILKYKNSNIWKKKKYKLIKFKKSNQNTCINFTPIVKKNQKVKKNQLLCHGYGIHKENISLGKDILVAFMPFKGYNFEDAIIVSNNILKKDTFTSLHIEKLDIKIKNTIFGAEKITRNVFKKKNDKKNLDNNGIIKVGSNIKPGDILVGILTPKKNNNVYPENKLLNFIFNKKNNNIKDNSYKAPNNLYGKILKVKIIDNKTQINKNIKNKSIIYDKLFFKELYLLLIKYKKNIINKYLYNIILKYKENECVKKIKKNINYLKLLKITNKKKINILLYNKYIKFLYKKEHYNSLYKKNNNFNIDIIKIIKIYVIKKRILQIGDKMSGKHGNKGVISKIEEDFNMPFLKNGKSIDMVINPLGVPSRMNIGQILETLLGMVGKKSNKKFLIKPFNSINYMNLNKLIKKCNLPKFCKFNIYDGYTGEKMHQKVTVGYLHMLKLNHMVSDKIHVRSVGPYSLITQQPLGGRSQYGGQRFGEMEVWALEAYGAAYFLRELLTLKSDDIEGRLKTYHSIIEDKELPDPNVPESFNVLIKELNGLNIDILFKYD